MVNPAGSLLKEAFLSPTVQLGKFNVYQDCDAVHQLVRSLGEGERATLSTAYFNVDESLCSAIVDSSASWEVITASPEANGFLGSSGLSAYIPALYLNAEHRFLSQVDKKGKANLRMLEWKKEGETFHGKGLWISSGSSDPHISVCGSSNYGKRSLNLDLEAQMILKTEDPSLQASLRQVRKSLHQKTR